MQIRRLTAATAAGLALAGLAGCRSAPNVAAYVGDDTVTVSELDSAVDDRLDDPAIAQSAAGSDRTAYTRQVLGMIVDNDMYEAAAERYGVAVSDADVRSRLADRLAVVFPGQSESDAYASLAAGEGLTRQDAYAQIRNELIGLAIAEEEGLDDPLSEAALRKRYEQTIADRSTVRVGFITVPDQKTADQVVAALDADPDRYGELAERFAGQLTLAEPREVGPESLTGPLQQAADAEPGTAFSVAGQAGGIGVVFVAPTPTFEELRPQLEQQAEAEISKAAQPLLKDVREDLDVVVNPRYGDLRDDGTITLPEDGVVKILEG